MSTSDDRAAIARMFKQLSPDLDERGGSRRWAAAESMRQGWGGIALVSEVTGIARSTIIAGRRELAAEEAAEEAGRGGAAAFGAEGGQLAEVAALVVAVGDAAGEAEAEGRGDELGPGAAAAFDPVGAHVDAVGQALAAARAQGRGPVAPLEPALGQAVDHVAAVGGPWVLGVDVQVARLDVLRAILVVQRAGDVARGLARLSTRKTTA